MSLDAKSWLTRACLDERVVALVATDRGLAQARADEQDDAHGSHDDELQCVPACPEDDEVEPAGAVSSHVGVFRRWLVCYGIPAYRFLKSPDRSVGEIGVMRHSSSSDSRGSPLLSTVSSNARRLSGTASGAVNPFRVRK